MGYEIYETSHKVASNAKGIKALLMRYFRFKKLLGVSVEKTKRKESKMIKGFKASYNPRFYKVLANGVIYIPFKLKDGVTMYKFVDLRRDYQ